MVKHIQGFVILVFFYGQMVFAAQHIIHISVDGLYAEAIKVANESLPNYRRLQNEGVSTLNARTDAVFTTTLPNHTSQFSARQVRIDRGGHGWQVNVDPIITTTIHTNAGRYISSIFDVVHDAGLSTSLFAGKQKFVIFKRSWNEVNGAVDQTGSDDGRNKIDRYEFNPITSQLVAEFIADLEAQQRHYAFVHIKDPDTAGHAYGWNITPGSEYLRSIKTTDNYLGQILTFIETSKDYQNSTVVILTSDHGGAIGTQGHPHSHFQSHHIPFFVWGHNISQGDIYVLNQCTAIQPAAGSIPGYDERLQPVRNADAANLSTAILGLPLIPSSQINTVKNVDSTNLTSCTQSTSSLVPLLFDN